MHLDTFESRGVGGGGGERGGGGGGGGGGNGLFSSNLKGFVDLVHGTVDPIPKHLWIPYHNTVISIP